MRLPASMQPWMEWLDQLDPELAVQLGKLILQIEPLFPAPRALPITGNDAFDGFNGIINRGHYERLLSSEWMLAEDLPEEFMRRAVENEHMFLAPLLIEPRNDGTCCVIFDTGAHQLGAVRVFHVAMWLVLVRRAAQRGTVLRWAIAQQPAQVSEDCSIEGLKTLLGSRTLAEVDDTMQQQWHDYLADPQHQVAEQWWIGAPNDLCPIAPEISANRITIESCPLSEQTSIQLDAKSLQRKQQIQTPSGKLFSRLLKGQFQVLQQLMQEAKQPTSPERLVSRHQSLFLSPCGQYVAVLLPDRSVPVWRIGLHEKNSRKQVSRYIRPIGEFVAFLFDGKIFGGLNTISPEELYGWRLPKHSIRNSDNQKVVIQHGLRTKMPAVLLRNNDQQRLYLLDHKRQLHWRTASSDYHETKIIAKQVQSLYAVSYRQMIYAVPEQEQMVIKCTTIPKSGDTWETKSYVLDLSTAPKKLPDKILLCRNINWQDQKNAAWAAYDQGTKSWWIGHHECNAHSKIKPAQATHVIALIRDMHQSLGLLVLQPDHRTLTLLYGSQPPRILIESPYEIIHTEISSHHLAWIDTQQQLHFLELHSELRLSSIDLEG